MREVEVLIVGGGPVGLAASILLSRFGISSLLVERHPGTSIHPKARGINVRTMEIFRQRGVEDAVRAAGLPPERARFLVWAPSLPGEELERRVPWRAREEAAQYSPLRNCLCAQDDREPVLRRHAESLAPGALAFDTGVQDVHNLAWKLAAVLHGWGGPALLDSYEDERLPYGRAITEQSLMNARSLGRGAPGEVPALALGLPEVLNELRMIFGATYESSAVVPDGTPRPKVDNPITEYRPSGRPGSRAAHAWLERAGTRCSTLDLFGRGFVL